jgi:pimeloyl-ACP methyl ester carboxylesterase
MARHIPGPLYFVQQGASGMPMLFIHSTPDDHRLWYIQTAHFSSWYCTIAVDLAGYGHSPAPQQGVRVTDQAEACWEMVDRITSGPVIVHGNSLGSHVAMYMAKLQPKRIPALILSGCGYLPTRENMLGWLEKYRAEGIGLRYHQILDHFAPDSRPKPEVQHYARMVNELTNQSTLNSIIAMNEALSIPDPEELFAAITSPTIIISGTRDRNHQKAFDLVPRIKGSEIFSIENAGHSMMIEQPWEYDAICIRFLTKLGLFPGGE